ncbi:MAG: hypothetical protein IJ555_00445 [Ruminococcus sp.]|nr:hypothetical protein [Ruminococcus sp.]MBR1750891.1 hypothetical protein [Ruminococcus sp.]
MNELTFKGQDSIKAVAWLAGYVETLNSEKEYTVTVKEKKAKRSLDANAYAWVLIDKLAERLHESKIELYKQYIREIGGVSETVCVLEKAADRLCEGWEHSGIGWQTDRLKSKLEGCINVVLYYGSSVYDTAQMSRLIDLIVQDCRALGIETKDPAELERLVEAWGGDA